VGIKKSKWKWRVDQRRKDQWVLIHMRRITTITVFMWSSEMVERDIPAMRTAIRHLK